MWEALDQERGTRVALKQLRHLDTGALLRFKREFRALADVRHRNLVRLGELVSQGDEWFFTLELVDGVNLLRFVRDEAEEQEGGHFDEGRLRESFAQLAEGLQALHAAGMLHRDLKPSNVLVSREGRVVILDFGLVSYLGPEDVTQSTQIVGTPAYMSPEQGMAEVVGPASDWYSVGVMLYQALTGSLPFEGNVFQLIFARNDRDIAPASSKVAGLPDDLDRLCTALLSRDPAGRPGAEEVLAVLRGAAPAESVTATPSEGVFVGRAGELEAIRQATAEVRRGRTAVVHLRGLSGMGKSTLARRALQEIAREPGAIVLSGRCYPRESVPYKALDSVIDELAQRLARMPETEAARYLPRDWAPLTRLFPVLADVTAGHAARRATTEIQDATELRRRAFGALRELLGRLGDHRTLVLYIDDLHWGDHDSGLLLRELLRQPEAPPLLLLTSYRSDEVQASPLLQFLEAREETGLHHQVIDVGVLGADDARALAAARLGAAAVAANRMETLIREAGGSPFLVEQLAATASTTDAPDSWRLESVLEARLARLPGAARQLLQVLAMAGGPMAAAHANQAAGLDPRDDDAIGLLEANRWVRRRAGTRGGVFETYHDRLRETVVGLLDEAERVGGHRRIAEVLDASGEADPETLAEHYLAARMPEPAGRHAAHAADLAARALAFDRAARLYRMALDLAEWPAAERRSLEVRLGDALVGANRGEAAARVYLAAAEGADAEEALDLRRRAGTQFLITGLIDEGLEVLRGVLAMVKMRYPGTPGRALASFLARRAQLSMRGLAFRPRPADSISVDLLRRIDTCRSMVLGIGMVDVIRAAHFQALHLLYALKAGDPYRVARALIHEMGITSAGGTRATRRQTMLRDTARALAGQLNDPYITAWLHTMEGIARFLASDQRSGLAICAEGEARLREHCTGVMWEVETAQLYQVLSLALFGRMTELEARALPLLEDARERHAFYLSTFIETRVLFLLRLAADDAAGAAEVQAQSLARWSRRGFQVQHYWNWYAHGEIDLYQGRPAEAWRRIADQWRAYATSLTSQAQSVHIEILHLRARAAIGCAAGSSGREAARWLARAETDARRLDRERNPWADALALFTRALIADQQDVSKAVTLYEKAAEAFAAMGHDNRAMAARYRRGLRLGGEEGRAAVDEAAAWMTSRGVRNPSRMFDMLAPSPEP